MKGCTCHNGAYPRFSGEYCQITAQKISAQKYLNGYKRNPIKAKSKKQRKKDREYSDERKAAAEKVIENVGWVPCEIRVEGCMNVATDWHHPAGRLSGRLMTERVWCCRSCHDWAETHPEEAKKLGVSKSRLEKK